MSDLTYFDRMLAESKWTYRIPLITWPVALLRPFTKLLGRNAVDLGVNIGTFCLVYGQLFYSITAVDASSECVSSAKKNLRDRNNVRFIHGVLAEDSGEAIELRRVYFGDKFESKDFTSIEWDEDELGLSDFKGRPGDVEEIAQSISWEDVVQAAGGGVVDFLKCDIEGAEYDLLCGKDLSMVRVLVLELHYTALGKARTAELLAHLEGYFDYLDSSDRMLFRKQWPPPGILRMAKKGAGQRKFFLAWRGVELYRKLSAVVRRISRFFRGS